jgi:hypothetical protein
VEKAREASVDEAEILEAVSVGRMVRKGAAGRLDREATSFLGEID